MIKMIQRNWKKFYSLKGLVALIFSIFFLRNLYIFILFPGFWNLLSMLLLGVFAYWWIKSVLGTKRYSGKAVPHRNRTYKHMDF